MQAPPTTVRLPMPLHQKLLVATDRDRNPYAPTVSKIVQRGVELALKEMEKRKGSSRDT